jgi:hypothetical protein
MLFFRKRCAAGRPSGIDETQMRFRRTQLSHSHFNTLKVSIHRNKEFSIAGSLRHAVSAVFMEAARGCLIERVQRFYPPVQTRVALIVVSIRPSLGWFFSCFAIPAAVKILQVSKVPFFRPQAPSAHGFQEPQARADRLPPFALNLETLKSLKL